MHRTAANNDEHNASLFAIRRTNYSVVDSVAIVAEKMRIVHIHLQCPNVMALEMVMVFCVTVTRAFYDVFPRFVSRW